MINNFLTFDISNYGYVGHYNSALCTTDYTEKCSVIYEDHCQTEECTHGSCQCHIIQDEICNYVDENVCNIVYEEKCSSQYEAQLSQGETLISIIQLLNQHNYLSIHLILSYLQL